MKNNLSFFLITSFFILIGLNQFYSYNKYKDLYYCLGINVLLNSIFFLILKSFLKVENHNKFFKHFIQILFFIALVLGFSAYFLFTNYAPNAFLFTLIAIFIGFLLFYSIFVFQLTKKNEK